MNIDADHLPELTKRQEEILGFIIRTYTEKPEPVSSKHLADSFELGVSSATIRNEMSVLEDLGYIRAPHTSAGRIPSENGYRYFVSRLIGNSTLTKTEEDHIAERFRAVPMSIDQWMRFAATMLARTARTASLVTAPNAESARFKHVELVSIQGRLVLMVLVLHGGIVQQRMLNLAEPIPQTRLAEVAKHINTLLADLYANQVKLKSVQLPLLEREVVELIAELMAGADSQSVRTIYQDGLSEIISNFQDDEGALQAVRVFEERAFLDILLGELTLDPIQDDVRVIVAGDGHYEELNRLSFVFSRYGIPGQMMGTIGVLGPTHINYGRAISSVRYVSGMMSNMLEELYQIDAPDADTQDDAPPT